MFDINAVINAAITQAVDSHVRGLVAAQDLQTQALEQMQVRLNDMAQRLEMLSASVHGQVGQQLNADLAQQLDNAEWFWDRVSKFVVSEESGLRHAFEDMAEESVVDERFMRKLIRLLDFDNVVSDALDNIDLADKFDIKDAVNDALEDINLLDSVEDEDFSDKVKEVLGELTFSLDIK